MNEILEELEEQIKDGIVELRHIQTYDMMEPGVYIYDVICLIEEVFEEAKRREK